ncbi:MAG: LytTR family transcriptional regulator [Xanthomonadaceae bacterium]|nr:LytTR family transcriptional regulator [Xanthomonadaceae bacterium]
MGAGANNDDNIVSHSASVRTISGSSELAPVLIGWGVFMTYLVVQCMAHQAFVSQVAVDLWDSIAWACREWGVWIVMTPVLLRSVRKALRSETKAPYLIVCLGCLVLALGLRVTVDVIETAEQPLASLIYFSPKHLGAWVAVMVAGWWLSSGKTTAAEERGFAMPAQPARSTRTLLVSKGRDECLIELEQVDSFSASKNYVEIRCGGQSYLLRSTLKELEAMLPPGVFVRTHRSHIVRIRAIDRVRMLPSGTGIVTLHDGSTVGISKKHYKTLDQYRCTRSGRSAQD